MKTGCLFILGLLVFFRLNGQSIKVFFNQPVDNSVSPITDAQTSSHLDDTICALINSSNLTLDLAVWDNGSSKIVTAINNAYNRGVQVRYISSTNSLNSALSGLNGGISVLKRNSGISTNVMHNKFIIVDNQKVLMGSMNFGNGSMFDDFNNIVIIANSGLAQNYTIEFNEMWGSANSVPNSTNSKFGPAKADNTTHNFNIGGVTIESYFSPTDGTSSKIVNAINSANYSLDIAMFTFIDNNIGDAVVAAKNRGVNVRCIIENVSYFGSEYNKLLAAGISVLSHENTTFDFHHKYCIIDAGNASSDPIVVTGSHNWTNSAESDYDENTLMIHNVVIANQYLEEFSKRYLSLVNVKSYGSLTESTTFYPNPNNGTFFLKGIKQTIDKLVVFNVLGEEITILDNVNPKNEINLNLEKGVYFINIILNNEVICKKINIE